MSAADEAKRLLVRGALDGMEAAAEDLLGKAVRDAPVDEGTLRGSAVITFIINGQRFDGPGGKDQALAATLAVIATGLALEMDAEVSFNTPYAAAQHEGIALMIRDGQPILWQVRNHPGGGRSKYLEANLLGEAPRYERVIAASAERHLRRGT